MDIHQFVAVTATTPAKIYGLAPRKGSIAVGADADLAIWDTRKEVTISAERLHDNVGYTPYEGRRIKGWPVTVLSRGRVVIEDGRLNAERGSGKFLERRSSAAMKPLGRLAPELDPVGNFGAELLR